MAWLGRTEHTFTTVADTLIAERADASTLHDVLAALMDHIGVPMMLAERYRTVPAIRALFAKRGVTLLDPKPGADERQHEFHDGPWAGEHVEIEPSPDGYEHLIPHRPQPGVGEWVPDDATPDAGRYVRTGSYGETTVMTWRPSLRSAASQPAAESARAGANSVVW